MPLAKGTYGRSQKGNDPRAKRRCPKMEVKERQRMGKEKEVKDSAAIKKPS
jgi:hypothetical protein